MFAKENRALSAEKLQGKYGTWVISYLVYYAVVSVVSAIFTFIALAIIFSSSIFITSANVPDVSENTLTIVTICILLMYIAIFALYYLLLLPMNFGYYNLGLKTTRNENIALNDFLYAKKDYKRVVKLELGNSIFVALWSLLFIIPGVMKQLSYSMSRFILIDNPEMTSADARYESMTLMNGHKWRLFCLLFSYVGWYILSSFTGGLLMLIITPRIQTSLSIFYHELLEENNLLSYDVKDNALS